MRRRSARGRGRGPDWRVVHQVSSWCLSYPDDEVLERMPALRQAVAEQPDSEPIKHLRAFLDHVEEVPSGALVREYIDLFDLSRQHTLYLSYWTDGDTRRRGSTLAEFKQHYRDSGFLVDTRGELPDHLPLVLEYAAVADPEGGLRLLEHYRAGLELIRLSLAEQGASYTDVLSAVCATLPGRAPDTKAEAMALARTGPPTESVGIEFLGYPTARPEAEFQESGH
ncbi:nitrate reductase molybdenum cofactor assembly chaperone [Nocardioides insulae]|uniref:nitrate reductase molybdenum cofactor assembly chaperone n=1 Tax=Nocardioides insulae TaxID=394734 RepID=UPI000684753E|nr:nitrate reductase molybdenum cofactor assembly chaperone [Nocardioides insulae]